MDGDTGGRRIGRTVTGAGRVLARAATAFAADAAGAVATVGELAADRLAGRARGPGVLRVEVVVLADETGRPVCPPEWTEPAVAAADRILTRDAGVRVRGTAVRVATRPAPAAALDPRANRDLLLDEITGRTAFYRSLLPPGDGALVGAPVTVLVVRSIAGRTMGCSLGGTADWVVVRASLFDRGAPHTHDDTVLAHELGHAVNLPHHPDRTNLMFPVSSPPDALRGDALTGWQAAVIRTNRHVVPGVGRARDAAGRGRAP